MASKSLGTLTLSLVAQIGGFTAGMTAAERASAKSAKEIEKNLQSINVAAVAVGSAIGEFLADGIRFAATAFPDLIEKAAKFQDLAEMTGGSAEGFASLAVAAATAGVDMESVAASSIKLTKNLTGVDDESKAAGAALAALGLNLKDFQALNPEQRIDALTKAFAGFADGTGKTAVAIDLWGKSGAEQLKLMKALEEQGGRTNILTSEQIRLADEFADKQAKAKAELGLYASAIATQFLPAITAFTGVLSDAAKELLGVGNESSKLGQNQGVAIFAENAIEKLAFVVDAAQGVKVVFSRLGEFIGASAAAAEAKLTGNAAGLKAIQDSYNESLDTSQFKSVRESYRKALADQKEFRRLSAQENRGFTPGLPNLNGYKGASGKAKGGGGAKDDPTKKLLDNDLAYFKAQGDAAKELLADRNKMLDLYNSQGLLSVKDYYAAQQGNLDEATRAQAKSIDDQIAALEKFRAAAKKDTDVADTTGKINKLEEEKAKLYRASGSAAIESSIKQAQAQKEVLAAFNEVNAKVLEYQGNLRAAGEIRFDAQNEKLIAQAQAEGNQEIVQRIQLLKQYTLAQADINKLSQQFSLAQGDLSIQEERITQARERGTMGEIQALKASGDARKAAVAIMQQQLAAFEAIDAAARSPEQNQAIERLKVQLEGLQATIDPLADRINTMFSDAAGNAFGDFINGTKTAKQAFNDFANAVLQDIGRMVAKDLAKQLFGGLGGSSGGVGGLFSSLLGSASSSSASNDVLGAFIAGKGFASGGFTGVGAANDPAGIVHKGEYVLTADQTRKIGVANLDRGNFGGQVVNFAIEGQVDRSTQTQIANRMRRTQNVAAARMA